MAKAKNKDVSDATLVNIDSERANALNEFLAETHKGDLGSVLRLNESVHTQINVVPTGAISLDIAIGAGGFPRGKITELFGPEGGGKTTVALEVAANAQRLGDNIGFIDAEHGLNRQLCDNIGIDPNRFVIFQPDNGEQAIEMTEKMILSKAFGVIIVDSVAALVPKAEIESEVEQQFMGLHARLMSKYMRRINGIANDNNVMLILVNQTRTNLSKYGNPEETTGGKAIKYFASLRIDVRTNASKKLGTGNDIIGHTIIATVKKNRLGAPHKTAEFDLIYGKGIDGVGALLDAATDLGVLTKNGSTYTNNLTGERFSETGADGKLRIVVGKESVKDFVRKNPALIDQLTKAVHEALNADMEPGTKHISAGVSDDSVSDEALA